MRCCLFFLVCTFFFFLFSCSDDNDSTLEVPICLHQKINKIKESDVSNPPTRVELWRTPTNVYYYFTSSCCDQYNTLYDANCNVVCYPDGGISGGGSQDCPEFGDQITKELVWEDPR